jgi:hypothetical protein
MTRRSSGKTSREKGATSALRAKPAKRSSNGSKEPVTTGSSDRRERRSHELSEDDWKAIDDVAAAVGAIYSGRPSWRRLLLMIARREVKVRKA